MGHNVPHTNTSRGKKVAVGLRNGQLVTGKFVRRAANNRWIEVTLTSESGVSETVRIPKAEIVSFCTLKGPLDLRRIGRGRQTGSKNREPRR